MLSEMPASTKNATGKKKNLLLASLNSLYDQNAESSAEVGFQSTQEPFNKTTFTSPRIMDIKSLKQHREKELRQS